MSPRHSRADRPSAGRAPRTRGPLRRRQGNRPTSERLAHTALLIRTGDSAGAFVSGLQDEGVLTLVTEEIDDAIEAAVQLRPDLVIVQDPGTNSGPFVRRLRGVQGVEHILVLIESTDPQVALDLLASGADDVVLPPHTVQNVLLRARLVRERAAVQMTLPQPFRTIQIDRSADHVRDDGRTVELSGREQALLHRLVSAGGEVVARTDLLRDIWGSDQESVTVLDATVHRLRRKIEANPSSPKILTTVRGEGYRIEMARVELT